MQINFLKRELKKGKIEIDAITIPCLLVIRDKYPEIWQQLKNLINHVDDLYKRKDY